MTVTTGSALKAPAGVDRWGRRQTLIAFDVLGLTAAALAAGLVRVHFGDRGVLSGIDLELLPMLMLVPVMLGGLALTGAYRMSYLNLAGDTFRRYLLGVGFNILAVGFGAYLFEWPVSRSYLGLVSLFALFFGLVPRALLRGAVIRDIVDGRGLQRVLVAGSGPETLDVALRIHKHAPAGYEVVGLLADDVAEGSPISEFNVVGDVSCAQDCAHELRASAVIASSGGLTAEQMRDLWFDLEDSDVELIVYPSMFEMATRRVALETVADLPLLHVQRVRLTRGRALLKRSVDIAVSSVGLVLGLPLLLAGMIAVRLESPGSPLFRQTRVGRDGDPFTLYKLRTMVDNAEDLLLDLADDNEITGNFFKIRNDPRVTRVGRHLRAWSIDEIPQLWNVLKGDMSLVGPRPPLPDEVLNYEDWHLRRLRIKPGITGVWQVSGRSEVHFDDAVRLDIFYIENWSLGYDLFLLSKTVMAVVKRHGAY